MSTYVILSRQDTAYQMLERIFTENPALKNGFTLRGLLRSPSVNWEERKSLMEMSGDKYTNVLAPEFDFEYQGDEWMVEVMDAEKRFHQFVTKVLDRALKSAEYSIGPIVSKKDIKLVEFLMKKENEVYQKDLGDFETEVFSDKSRVTRICFS